MAKDLTVGKPFKVILTFALPMIIANIFQQLYNIVDTAVVGQLCGSAELAGVGSTASMVFLIVQVAMGASVGCSVVISQLFGAKRLKDTKTAIYTTLVTMGVMGAVFTLVGVVFVDGILGMLSTPADIYDLAKQYLQIYFYGCIPMLLYNGITSAFNALGESKLPLYFLIFSSFVNIGLDFLLVLPPFNMGVAGVAWATFVAQTLACAMSLFVLLKKVKKIAPDEKANAFDKLLFKKIMRIGLPSMLQQSVISVGHLFVQALVNSYGATVIAGFTAATKVEGVLTSTFVNIGNALSSFTAQNIACKQIDRVKQGFKTTFYIIAGLSVVMLVLSLTIAEPMLSIFMDTTSSAEAVAVGKEYIQIVGCTYLVCGMMVIENGVLRGAGDVKAVVFCSVCNIFCRVGGAYLFAHLFGQSAIWWAVSLGWLVGTIISLVRYCGGKWKTKSAI